MPDFAARSTTSAPPKIIRNHRTGWDVRGALPRPVSLSLAAMGFLLSFLAWWLLSHSSRIDPVFLPTPDLVLKRCIDWFLKDDLISGIGISMGRVFGGSLPLRCWRCRSA